MKRFRDIFARYVPPWLSERTDKTVAHRVQWSLIAPLDVAAEFLRQGLIAPWPGKGTLTALPYIGRSRLILRGQGDTDAEYAEKLLAWLDTHREAGSQKRLALAIHEYLYPHPRVRVVNRAGHWITVEEDGTITTAEAAFDWDSVSHPERADYWSDLWVIVYPTEWAHADDWGVGTWGDAEAGLGHEDPLVDYDAVNGLVAQFKAAHSRVRAIIWTSDTAAFDPDDAGSLPNGEWGAWGTTGASRVASDRDLTTTRYWEPR